MAVSEEVAGGGRKELRLHSPAGGDPVIYQWPLAKSKQYDAAGEIMETIKYVCNEYHELKEVMEKVVKMKEVDTSSYEAMKSLCDKFSKAADTIKSLWKGTTRPNNPDTYKASKSLLRHIVQQVYNRSVSDPEKLNHYAAFSPETYGETSFDMVSKILEEVRPTDKDVFVDLGSGVGQVVIHVAGDSGCKKCVGIEKADIPSKYAAEMQSEFKRWMAWYGKKSRPFELKQADFLNDEFRKLILHEATIIFVNNYAFGPQLDQKLKEIFKDLKPNTRIVSSKPFCGNRVERLTHRHMTDLSGIMDVRELTPVPSSVSWTCNNVSYYLHTINPTKLEKYFFSGKKSGESEDSRRNSISSKGSSKSSSRDSSRSRDSSVQRLTAQLQLAQASGPSEFSDDKIPFGPTTRRQWTEWVTQQEKVKKSKGKEHHHKDSHGKAIRSYSTDSSSSDGMGGRGRGRGKGRRKSLTPKRPPSPPPFIPAPIPEPPLPVQPPLITQLKVKPRLEQYPETTPFPRKPGPGRPRKIQSQSATELKAKQTKRKYTKHKTRTHNPKTSPSKKDDLSLTLDILHAQTLRTTAGSVEVGPGDVRISSLRLGDKVQQYAGLDQFIESMKEVYIIQLEKMKTEEFRNEVLREIQHEKSRNDTLMQRTEYLDRQVKNLQEDGVRLLKQRMTELNIKAETPSELLNQSKEIVLRHKELQNEATRLGAEVSTLERQNQTLVSLCRERDEQTVQSGILQTMGFPTRLSVETAKEFILGEIGMHFTRQRALLSEVARMESEVVTLQTNIPSSLLPYLDTTSAINLGLSQPNPPTPSAGTQSSVPVTHSPAPTVQTTQALAPSTGHRASKRGRSPRGGGGAAPPRKRMAAATGGAPNPKGDHGDTDPKRQEEIEKQIQDIVQKALSVDNAAKSAEKERRAKNADKKKMSRGTGTAAAGTRPPHQASTSQTPSVVSLSSSASQQMMPTFSSPGLVPVPTPITQQSPSAQSGAGGAAELLVSEEERQRPASGSSTETESAPSDQETVAVAAEPVQDRKISEPAMLHSQGFDLQHRPSSVPVGSRATDRFSIAHLVGGGGLSGTDLACQPSRAHSALPRFQ